MAQFVVPIFVVIEAPSVAHAAQTKKAVEELVKNDFVKMALSGANVPYTQLAVGDAYVPVGNQKR